MERLLLVSDVPKFVDQTSIEEDAPLEHAGGRSPLAAVALSVIAGILIDHWLGINEILWIGTAVSAVLLGWLAGRYSLPAATISLLIGCAAVGGLRHHFYWSSVTTDDVSWLVTSEPRPIRVVGIVETPVTIVAADDSAMTPAWMQIDRSMCDLRCERIESAEGSRPVSGSSRLLVTGHVLHVDVGDRVEVIGQLVEPRGLRNPGGFDYRQYLRRQGVRALIDCDHPDAVKLRAAEVTERLGRWRSKLRYDCEDVFARHLDRRTAPLAASLLLGERSQLPWEVREAFVESGTMHLLAISGLHVGILAGLLLVVCRLLNLSVPATTAVVLIGVGSFAFITNLRPPVVRATVLTVVVAAGWPMYRRIRAVNLLAACALVVLLMNPTDLFDTGTQLSFLAVLAIGWAASFIASQRRSIDEESLLPRLFARHRGVARSVLRLLAEGYVVTTAIWLFTLPLTAAQFHVAAPVGFVVNVLLIPYVAIVLGLGFCTMMCGLLLPWFVSGPAWLFGVSLHGLLWIVDVASSWHLGHVHLLGPPAWWLAVFYLLLGAILVLKTWPPIRRWGWSAVWGWVIAGQLAAFASFHRDTLRCTVLDVGHGCCVVLQLPGGQNLLYDAGMFAGERRGQRVIQSALWDLGISQIDGIIVSHADVDHFNAAAGLMRTMPVGSLLLARSFLDFDQPPVAALCEAAKEVGVPVQLLQAGDRLATNDPALAITVVHPADGWQSEHDNANSLVLRVDFAGRSILLTGDLEKEGLTQLISVPATTVDVLLAPHHGSRLANPTSLAAWADPEAVVVSGGTWQTAAQLKSVYHSSNCLLTTHDCGAVTLECDPDGHLRVRPYVEPSVSADNTPM